MQEQVALGERLGVRDHGAHLLQVRSGEHEQAVLDAAHHLGVELQVQLGDQVVGLGHAAGGGVLHRHQRHVHGAVLHRHGRAAERLVAGEQRSARPARIEPRRGDVAVCALHALVRHAQRELVREQVVAHPRRHDRGDDRGRDDGKVATVERARRLSHCA